MRAKIIATNEQLRSEGMFDIFEKLGIKSDDIVELDHTYNPKYVFSRFKINNIILTINTNFIKPIK